MKSTAGVGYLFPLLCERCLIRTDHLILHRSIECKRCLTTRERRASDPPPAS